MSGFIDTDLCEIKQEVDTDNESEWFQVKQEPEAEPEPVLLQRVQHAEQRQQRESVTERTFKRWPSDLSRNFIYDINEETGKLENLRCLVCSENWEIIKEEAIRRRLKGQVLVSLKQYVEGVQHVHRGNVDRHCKPGSLHEFALMHQKEKYGEITHTTIGKSTCTRPNMKRSNSQSASSSMSSSNKKQEATVDVMLNDQRRDTCVKMFNTALYIVMQGEQFCQFPKLIALQKKNGCNLLPGKSNSSVCAHMVKIMADVLREDIKDILKTAKFLSGDWFYLIHNLNK